MQSSLNKNELCSGTAICLFYLRLYNLVFKIWRKTSPVNNHTLTKLPRAVVKPIVFFEGKIHYHFRNSLQSQMKANKKAFPL